jgi:hypothetical protein
MFAIIYWKNNDNYVDFVKNEDGSIKLFDSLKDADRYANEQEYQIGEARVVSLEEVAGDYNDYQYQEGAETEDMPETILLARMSEIEDEVINRYLEKSDFDVLEWMTDEELAEYKKLYKQVWGEKDYQERFGED